MTISFDSWAEWQRNSGKILNALICWRHLFRLNEQVQPGSSLPIRVARLFCLRPYKPDPLCTGYALHGVSQVLAAIFREKQKLIQVPQDLMVPCDNIAPSQRVSAARLVPHLGQWGRRRAVLRLVPGWILMSRKLPCRWRTRREPIDSP